MANYTVGEDAGVVDDLIYVAKEDGRASEQTLRVFVEVAPNQGRCIRGMYRPYIGANWTFWGG